jgi:glycosyltransferase involved in cell wall biosynthesis
MQILHIYKDYPPVLGGIENHVRLLAEAQAGRGHSVTVLVTNPAESRAFGGAGRRTIVSQEGGVQVVRAARLGTIVSTPLSLALPQQLSRLRPDVVHLHFPYPVGEVSQWLLRRGRATVLTYHSDVVRQRSIMRFYRSVLVRVLAWVDAIIVGSPPMLTSSYLQTYRDKLRLIPYGIPLDRFRKDPTAEALARLRSLYGDVFNRHETPRECFLLFVGRLRYYKGLDTLIRALPGIPARLLVVGVGPMEQEWKTLAADTGAGDKITWLGEVSDADLPAFYHAADIFVLPASHSSEAFGLVQVEAMAAGLPVVCTELGTGTSYVNQNEVTGLVVPPLDAGALRDAINRLIMDPGLRASMGEAARVRASEFDLDRMVESVLSLYKDVKRDASLHEAPH